MTTYKSLLAQREVLNEKIEEAKKAETTAAIARARELVAQYELTVEDVFSKTVSKKGKKIGSVAPKYRDPQTGKTWSGRGKPPLWISGKDRRQFII